jgi:hypothetical protein
VPIASILAPQQADLMRAEWFRGRPPGTIAAPVDRPSV